MDTKLRGAGTTARRTGAASRPGPQPGSSRRQAPSDNKRATTTTGGRIERLTRLSRLQSAILAVLHLRGGRLWMIDLAGELRNEGASAAMVIHALDGLMQEGLVRHDNCVYELTPRAGRQP